MEEKIIDLAKIFSVLSNEVRLCILINLCNGCEKNVGELQKCSNSSQSFVSQQLSKLKDLGIIKSRKQGIEVFYSISNEEIRKIIKNVYIGGETNGK